MTPGIIESPFFALDNAETWIKAAPFAAYLHSTARRNAATPISDFSRANSPSLRSRMGSASRGITGSPPRSRSTSLASSRYPDVLYRFSPAYQPRDLSGDESSMALVLPLRKRHRSQDIELSQSDNEDPRPQPLPSNKKRARKSRRSTQIKITPKLHVDSIQSVDAIPTTWDVPRDNTIYDLNLSGIMGNSKKTLDAFIRSEVSTGTFCHIVDLNRKLSGSRILGGFHGALRRRFAGFRLC